MTANVLRGWCGVLAALAAVACGSDDGGNAGSGGAAGTMVAGTGGTGGTAGTIAGTGGTAGTMAGTGGTAGTAAPNFVRGSPTFTAIFEEVIKPGACAAGAFCHGGTVGMGNLLLTDQATAHAQLVGIAAMGMSPPPAMSCAGTGVRVVAGSPDMSLLMQKLSGTQTCGTAMPPPPGVLIDAAKQMQVRTWIMNGALND